MSTFGLVCVRRAAASLPVRSLSVRSLLVRLGLAAMVVALPATAFAADTTSISFAVNGSTATPGTSVGGTVETLTAIVTDTTASPATLVPYGTVLFCDDPTNTGKCTGTSLLGTAQLVSSYSSTTTTTTYTGKATFYVKLAALATTSTPHYLFAKFLPQAASTISPNGYTASISSTITYIVSSYTAASVLAATGTTGNYTLTDTVLPGPYVTPVGSSSFLDTTASTSLGTETLGSVTSGIQNLENYSFFDYPASTNAATSGLRASRIVLKGDFNNDGIPIFSLPETCPMPFSPVRGALLAGNAEHNREHHRFCSSR